MWIDRSRAPDYKKRLMIVDLQVNLDTKEGAPLEPEALITGAKNAGLDGLLLTKEGALSPDVASYRDAGKTHGVTVFSGAKLATNHGIILCILPKADEALPDDFASKAEGIYDANAVIDAIEQRGGVTIALRPYDRDVPRPMGDHLFSLQGLSACEVQNGRLPEIANDLALEAASNMEMPCVGSSCADGLEGLGTSATLFRAQVTSESELCDAIRKGDCWPVSFSDQVPIADQSSDRGGQGRGMGGDDSGRRRGRRGGRRRRDGGPDRGSERGSDRGEVRARSNGEGDRRPAGDRGPSERAPAGDRGPGGGDRGGDRRGGGGGDRGFGGGGAGGDRRGGRGRRGGGGGGGGRGGDRALGGGGGGGGGRGRPRGDRPDDFGNRARPQRGPGDDNVGNTVRSDERDLPSEDIGNRLRPGERPLFAPRPAPAAVVVEHDPGDDDDNSGNR